MRQIQDPDRIEQAETFNFGYLVGMQVQNLEFGEFPDVLDLGKLVLGHHQDLEGGYGQIFNIPDEIIVQVEVEEVGQGDQIFDPPDFVVLEGQHLEPLLAFQQWDVVELQSVQVDLLAIGFPLDRAAVAHPDVGDLLQLREYYVA